MNNRRLEEENEKLKNIINNQKKEINELKNNIQNLQNNNSNEILSNVNQINNNEIKKLKNEITQKDKEINELKLKIPKKNVDMNDVMVINFISTNQAINCGIPCLADDTFAEVEEKLYQQFDEYRNTNNFFLFKGNQILRYKKVRENNISNGDKIQIVPPE